MWSALSAVQDLITGINPATLNGAIDVVVVRQADGTLRCSPFHVRFGKASLILPKERVVHLTVNGERVEGLPMKMGSAGEGFFVCKTETRPPERLCTSPILTRHRSPLDEGLTSPPSTSPPETPGMMEGVADDRPEPIVDWDWGDLPVSKDDGVLDDGECSASSSRHGRPSSGVSSPTHSSPGTPRRSVPATSASAEAAAAVPITGPTSALVGGGYGSYGAGDTSLDHSCDSASELATSPGWLGLDPQGLAALGVDDDMVLDDEGGYDAGGRRRRTQSGPSTAVTASASETAASSVCSDGYDSDVDTGAEADARSGTDGEGAQGSANGVAIMGLRNNGRAMETAAGMASSLPATLSGVEQRLAQQQQEEHRQGKHRPRPPGFSLDDGADRGDATELYKRVQLSRCGPIDHTGKSTTQLHKAIDQQLFDRYAISWQQFAQDPSLLFDPALVVHMNNKFMSWQDAAPQIMSLLVFGRRLPSLTDKAASKKGTGRKWGWFSWKSQDKADATPKKPSEKPKPAPAPTPSYTKTLKLTSDQLKQLNLRDGANRMTFSVYSKLQGKSTVSCTVFLWNHDDKIVISDVDGTITKSDVLGHAANLLGTDWTHEGVASLFSAVRDNGYKLLYLSSRSIGYSGQTKGYLQNIRQDQAGLPDGPLLLTPTSLLRSLHVEVIIKRPEEFKISCLQDIRNLFRGSTDHPFVAGFGNRATDAMSYRAVGVPDSKIFIIDPRGLVKQPVGVYRTRYAQLLEIVDQLLPPLTDDKREEEDRSYDNFVYWQNDQSVIADDDFLADLGLITKPAA
eukprot:m.172691 g.172691  ORF g.172691 m.172691 type:complete len:797 (-) comp17861_c0_seq2:159-2549(-)